VLREGEATMCTYYYLHYHHVEPCSRGVDWELQYRYCPRSTVAPASSSPLSHQFSGEEPQTVQVPCDELTHAPECNPNEGIDYDDPCANGGCLMSQQCTSGGCRLEDLNGRWFCCRCTRGGNTFSSCFHPMRRVPDTLCYHTVCQSCWADV
jgi:hypothetical protein